MGNYRNRYIGIAVGILILIVGGLTIFNPFQSDTSELFETYFKPYPNVVAPISKGETDILFYEKAFQLYEVGDYEKANIAFDSLYQNETVLFYKSLTLLQLEKPKKAQILLEKIVADKGEFGIPTKWFLALTYLKRNQRKKAKKVLEQITEPPYHQEAKALYDAL